MVTKLLDMSSLVETLRSRALVVARLERIAMRRMECVNFHPV